LRKQIIYVKIKLNSFVDWFLSLFGFKKCISLGIYGAPNVGKTTLANRIALDWTGEEIGKVSEIPHETRWVQKKEKIEVKVGKKKILINLLDMPGIATKIDYRQFLKYGLSKREAKQRAREATEGVIEAIKWLKNVDTVLAVMDATQDPLTQVNITLLGNLEARKIPVIIVANKIDKKSAKPKAIREAFPNYPVVEISALKGINMDKLYSTIANHARYRR
jgi:small GTP-binding protein